MRGVISATLLDEIRDVGTRLTLLQAGAILHPLMVDDAELRYGRSVAAQLAALAMRGHVRFSYGDEYPGPQGIVATRLRDLPDDANHDEQRLMDIVFEDAEVARIARSRPGAAWDGLAALIHRTLKLDGLGWSRRERYRLLWRLVRLRSAVRNHAQTVRQQGPSLGPHDFGRRSPIRFDLETGRTSEPPPGIPQSELEALMREEGRVWCQDPALYGAGYPFTVLFAAETGPRSWPSPPEEEMFVPSLLAVACQMAIANAT